jgi:hypothetical protein
MMPQRWNRFTSHRPADPSAVTLQLSILRALQVFVALLLTSACVPVSGEDLDWHGAQALFQQYCWSCHGTLKHKADLDLQNITSPQELASHLELLQRRLVDEEMPPAKAPQPTAAERLTLVNWIKNLRMGDQLRIADDPGQVIMPHLTPSQYERSVQELTGVPISLAAQLPHDGGAGEGFDNVGSAQVMTPMLLQAYMQAAQQILSHVRIVPDMPLDWSRSSRGEPPTTKALEESIMEDWVGTWQYYANKESELERAEIAPLVVKSGANFSIMYYDFLLDWLPIYMDAAWQYRYRSQLGHPQWTIPELAAAYKPALHSEVLERLIPELGSAAAAQSTNFYWRMIANGWEKLPPPPAADDDILKDCGAILNHHFRHSVRNGDDSLQAHDFLQPFEIDPATFLTRPEEPRTVMILEGRRPMRMKLTGMHDLYLVTTDAGDGPDDDVMIWEHGVIECNGHDQPWTVCTVTDGTGAPVPWGSHPKGPAAGLAMDSIAVQAPAVLHLILPAGTTGMRIDARADPTYAKNGSMQVVPLDHMPTEDQLHFVVMRNVIGAPKSRRVRDLLNAQIEMDSKIRAISIAVNYRLFPSLLPEEVIKRWKIPADPGHGQPHVYTPWLINGVRQLPIMWDESDATMLAYLPDRDKSLVGMQRLKDELRGTIEARDILAEFLGKYGKFNSENPAEALNFDSKYLAPAQLEEYQRLLAAAKADEERLQGCARAHLTAFAERAWRQPLPDDSREGMIALYKTGRDLGLCYGAALKRALTAILISPHFLYREQDAHRAATAYALSGRELAERLAFTLWGSIPDQELLKVGQDGHLQDPVQLRQQITRMLVDPRAQALASEFAAQAFLFAGFDQLTGPDPKRFPEFTASLRSDMFQECQHFFSYVFQQDRPLTEIIDSDYVFVNQGLADFYGIPNVQGGNFRQVKVDRRQRGGVLSLGAILVTTSPPLRTSPVKRGNWILSQVLGTPPPPPPPVVPQFSHDEHDEHGLSIIQQMKIHRSDARCITCHSRIDPLGVSLERFDPLGRLRKTNSDGTMVSDLETTVDGTQLQGLESLKDYLLKDPQRQKVMRNLCTKFLGYALGRAVIPSDDSTIDSLMHALEANGWHASVLIAGVLTSPQFTQRRDVVGSALDGKP